VADRPSSSDPSIPLTPDELEQRQRADGTFESDSAFDEEVDEPLTPDMIEQRQVIEADDEEEHPSE
jgi:hypothetical protein